MSTELPIQVHTLPFLRAQKDGSVLVDIHVMPNAAKTQTQGLHDGALKVRLHAPPVDGKANEALQAWLAETLNVPKSAVELVRGQTARRKQLCVAAHAVSKANWSALD
jgi:uncharacterized protein (TIGR00251 family)